MRLRWTCPFRSGGISILLAVTAAAQTSPLQRESARDCTVCHLSWMDGFGQPDAILLVEQPEEPAVDDDQTCLGCHDGSVADSRRRVWLEHGHKTGIVPPPGMEVPDALPLDDGRIVCRTCHTAHSDVASAGIAGSVFLRVRNDASQL